MLNSNIEYDMNMTVIKIHKKKDEIKWLKLIEYKEDYISIGSILEIPNLYDFENRTQVIVFDSLRDNCGLALLVVSGIKAGSIYVIFPEESKYKNTRMMSKNGFSIIFINGFLLTVILKKHFSYLIYIYNNL